MPKYNSLHQIFMLLFSIMKSVLKEIVKKNPVKHFNLTKKRILLLILLFLSITISIFVYLSIKIKPNDDIALLPSNSSSIYQNKNPNFTVNFGKRDNQEQQWVRFESKNSKSNPFDKSKKSFWQKIRNFFSPIKSYGVEMSLNGVSLTDIDRLDVSESEVEKIKSVSEILGDSTVKTSTRLIELGRELGSNEDTTKRTIVNGNIVNGIDLEYQIIKGKGLKEEIVIKNLDGYTKDCKDNVSECKLPPNEFVFDMKLDSGLHLKKGWFAVGRKTFETYYFEDNRGNYVSHFLPSFAVDRAGNKTYDVVLSVEENGDNKYKVKVSIDVQWLFSEGRVFPVRIDPSIVHSVKDDFDTGIYNGTQYVQSAGGVQLTGLDRPVVGSNTVGYWNFNNTGFSDGSGNANHAFKALNNLKYGVQHSNLSFVLNQYNGSANPGKIDIVCPNNDDSVCNIVDLEGNFYTNLTINSGINIASGATGPAYIMYSPSLSGQGIIAGAGNSTNFIVVRYSGSSWQYNNGTTWINFTPNANNFIVAQVTLLTSVTTLDIWPSLADGIQYKGIKFDGINDHLRLEDSTKADIIGDISVEFWIKLTKAEVQTIVHKDSQYSIRIRENGYITWGDSSDWSYANFGDHDIGLELGKWKNIVVTKSAGVVKIYADGVEKVSKSFGGSITSTNRILHIGCYSGTNACATDATYLSAYLDELKISNVAKTPDEIYKSYLYGKKKFSGEYFSTTFDSSSSVSQVDLSSNVVGQMTGDGETPHSTTGLVAQWNFNETSGTVASSAGSCGSTCNGTLTNFADTTGQDKVPNSGWTYDNRRWGGGALMFDGVDDKVIVNNNPNLNLQSDISLEVWFNLTSVQDSGYNHIIDKDNAYGFSIYDGNLCTYLRPVGWSCIDEKIDTNVWYFATVTYDGTNVKIYLNGRLVKTVVAPSTTLLTSTHNLAVGARQDGTLTFKGVIDTVRLYNRAITASEVSSNYNSNSVIYAIRGGDTNNPNDGTWSEWKDNVVNTTLKSFDNKYLYNEKESGLIAYWSFDNDNESTTYDLSGNGNNGVPQNVTTVDGKFGKAKSFNGVNSEILVPNNQTLNLSAGDFSYSFYIRAKETGWWQAVLAKNMNTDYEILINPSGKICHLGAPGFTYGVCSTTSLKVGEWYHVVGSREGNTAKIYVNGHLEGSRDIFPTGYTNNHLYLGARKSSSPLQLNADLDEFKIYNKALSLDAIQSEYLKGSDIKNTLTRNTSNIYATKDNTLDDGLVSHWKMDEESGDTVSDSVGTNNGSATGTTIVNGKLGKAREFNNSGQYVEIPNNSNLDINGAGSQVTMSAWFNSSSLSAHQTLIFKGDGNTDSTTGIYSNRQYALFLLMDGSLHLSSTSVNNVGVTETVLNTANHMSPILPNTWNHVVAVIDSLNGVMKIYLNGVFICSGPFSTTGIRQGSGNLYLGLNSTNYLQVFPYSGILDDVKIFNTAKTSDEILRMYDNELQNRSHRIGNTRNNDLIAYWKLDEQTGNQVNDSVGTNNGTATGTTIVNGRVGKGRSFNGTNEYIHFPEIDVSSVHTMSASVWVKTTTTTPAGMFFISRGLFMYINRFSTNGSVLVDFDDNSTNNNSSHESKTAINDGKWHLVTGTNDGTKTRLYIDGVLENEFDSTFTLGPAGDHTYLGAANGVSNFFNGSLDEAKIYGKALSSDEIFEEYASLKDSFERRDTGIVAYWSMNEATGNISRDIIHGFNGTATGTTIVNGVAERARNFDGTSGRVALSTGSQADIVGDITISTWVNIASGSASPHTILHKDNQYSIRINTDGKITWGDSSSFSYAAFGFHDIGFQFDKWQHITISKTGGVVKIYLNGVEKVSVTFGGPLTSKTGILHIGCYSNAITCAGAYLKGMIDEMKIYNRALSATEVANVYRYSVGNNSYLKSTYTNYTFTQNDLSNKISLPVYLASENVKESIFVTIGESAYANYQPDQYTVGLWHFDETDGTNTYIKDSSGYGNDGLPVGSTYISDGKIGGAMTFSSSNTDYIAINNSSNLNPSTITLEAWIKPKLTGNLYNVINKGNNTGYRIQLGSDGIVQFIDRGTTNLLSSNTKVVPNQWSHIVATGDSTGLKIYINGVLDASKTTAYGGAVTESPLYIGRYGTNKYFFSGDIDEVRISNIARSADEIRQAYEVGLRTHNVEIEFGAELDSTNLISGNTDKSFTIDATKKGLRNKGSNIHAGEKIIVKEKEYIAQGVVNSVNEDTGAITINSWDNISTFPIGGFTTKASVFKWQKEYLPIKGKLLSTHLDTAKLLTLRLDSRYRNGNVWVDHLMASEYVEPVYPQNISLFGQYRFFQYKGILTSTDTNASPIIRQVQLDYTPDGPTMEQVMRHGKWFSNGQKQSFWWAK